MKRKLIYLVAFIKLSITGCAQKTENMKSENESLKKVNLSEQEWKAKLTPEQYYVLREKGTEKPFSGEFVFTREEGTYKCAACGEPLFTDDMKFESHCGWPSFDKEIEGGKIVRP